MNLSRILNGTHNRDMGRELFGSTNRFSALGSELLVLFSRSWGFWVGAGRKCGNRKTSIWKPTQRVVYKLLENKIYTRRLPWLQAPEGGSKLLRREGARDTIFPSIGRTALVGEPGGLAAPGHVCPVLHELWGNGFCWDGAYTGGASRPASEFIDGAPCHAAGVWEGDGIDSFLPSLLFWPRK